MLPTIPGSLQIERDDPGRGEVCRINAFVLEGHQMLAEALLPAGEQGRFTAIAIEHDKQGTAAA